MDITVTNASPLQPPPPRIEVCGPPPNNQPTPIDLQQPQDDMCQTDHLNKQLLEAFLKRINDSSRFRSENNVDPLGDSIGPRDDSSDSLNTSTNSNTAAATESF